MKNICYLLNHSNDIPWAIFLNKNKPSDINFFVFITNFTHSDMFGWQQKTGKGKSINPCMHAHDISAIKKEYGSENITVLNSFNDFVSKVVKRNFDVVISRGKEFFIFPEFSKKSVALSMDRSFFIRLLHALPYYKNLNIFLQHEKWLDKDLCGNFCMSISGKPGDYSLIDKNMDKFKFVDIMGCYKSILDDIGIEKIRSDLGLKNNEKVAFLNFRKASTPISIYKTDNEFFKKSRSTILHFKSLGYKIISRERLDKENIVWDKSRGMHNAIKHVDDLIDIKVNGHNGYPPLVFRAVYASDIIISSDVSGICTKEGLICRKPVFLPYDNYFLEKISEKNKNHLDPVSPIFADMVNKNLIFNNFNEDSMTYFYNNVENFINSWYNTDINLFWQKILE